MIVDPDQVRHIARLSRIDLEEEEIPLFVEQFCRILDHFDKLKQIDTDDVEALSHTQELENVLAEDILKESFDPKLALQNAPDQEDGYFKVPKVLGDS